MLPQRVKQHPFADAKYVLGKRIEKNPYIQIPKTMLLHSRTLGISTDEVVLYSILHDRAKLSMKTSESATTPSEKKYVDEQGNIILFYPNSDICELLGWSMSKTKRVFKELQDNGLLESKPVYNKAKVQTGRKLYLRAWVGPNGTYSAMLEKKFRPLTAETIKDSIDNYYIVPKYMFSAEEYSGMNLRSILLYAIIQDRLHAGASNGHRIDEENNLVWTTLDADLIMRELDCSKQSLTNAYKELEDLGLIERRAEGFGEQWHIYARTPELMSVCQETIPPASAEQGTFLPQCPNFDTSSPKFDTANPDFDTQRPTNDTPASQKWTPSKLPSINPPYSNPSVGVSIPASAPAARDVGCQPQKKSQYLQSMASQVGAWNLLHSDDVVSLIYNNTLKLVPDWAAEACMEIRDELEDIIAADLASSSQYIVMGNQPIPHSDVIARYQQLDAVIVCILIARIYKAGQGIKNRKEYIRKALYLAPVQNREYAYRLRQTQNIPA